jgi:hypothetical protein
MKTKTPRQKRTNENCLPEPDWHESDDDEFGDIEHDEQAFYRELASWKRGVDRGGIVPGFQPAGIKAGDTDEIVVRKWQAYVRSPKCDHTDLPPKRVVMAMIRQDGGDRRLAKLGLNSYQVAEFNRGHITMGVLLAIEGGRNPGHDQEKLLARAIREYRDATKQIGYFQSFLAAGRFEQERQKKWRNLKFSPGPFLEMAEYEAKVKLFLERGLSKQQMLREIRKANEHMDKEKLTYQLEKLASYWDVGALHYALEKLRFAPGVLNEKFQKEGKSKEEMLCAMEKLVRDRAKHLDDEGVARILKGQSDAWDLALKYRRQEDINVTPEPRPY